MSFIKNFVDWFKLKPKLDAIIKSPNFSESEVWNCHWGTNIGFELDGKNEGLLRPVLIIKKLSHHTFIGIPLTTKLKDGDWYFPSNIENKPGRYIFAQVRVIDSRRLLNRIEKVDSNDFNKIKQAFKDFI